MKLKDVLPLFCCEIANNHSGSVKKAKELVSTFAEIAKKSDYNFAFKLQYRNIDTCIHPSQRYADIPIIKRFVNTALTWEEYYEIKQAIDESGAISICTPFDEESVDKIVEHGYDIIKVPSCYFREWILLEKIATTNLPIIASTGGWELPDIDDVVTFFEHRDKDFALMHCVAEYPMAWDNAQLDFIKVLRERYNVPVGFSSHEQFDNDGLVGFAIAKGAQILERHIGLDEDNRYSARPENIREWFLDAKIAYRACGEREISGWEKQEITKLFRGVYAKEQILAGEKLTGDKLGLAMPAFEGQLVGHDISKYTDYFAEKDVKKDDPIWNYELKRVDKREILNKIVKEVCLIIKNSGIIVPRYAELEISHHYGLDKFYQYGCAMITIINEEYCKKYIILLPEQTLLRHYHREKNETFVLQYGDVSLTIENYQNVSESLEIGKPETVHNHITHSFFSQNGGIIEEISTRSNPEDSYYEVPVNEDRKTFVRWRFE